MHDQDTSLVRGVAQKPSRHGGQGRWRMGSWLHILLLLFGLTAFSNKDLETLGYRRRPWLHVKYAYE